MKKTGFIAIVGRPNVGKSTLLNSILGEKVAIVSSKPQTTRNRIIGIHTVGDDQFVFLDTPGIFKPRNSLGSFMVKTANSSMQDADAVILVIDAGKPISDIEKNVIKYVKNNEVPSVLVLNKIDLYRREQIAETIAAYAALHDFDAVVPICAKNGKGVEEVLDECKKFLGESEFFFPEDTLTDQPERVLAAEMIREKLLHRLNEEIPHGIAVSIEKMREREDKPILDIEAIIYCERESHKGIVIGKKGAMLKEISTNARHELENFFECKVNLQCWVKVKEDWRNREGLIHNFGLD